MGLIFWLYGNERGDTSLCSYKIYTVRAIFILL